MDFDRVGILNGIKKEFWGVGVGVGGWKSTSHSTQHNFFLSFL